MSAQAGICNFDGRPVDPGLLGRMAASIAHYGPDGGGQHVRGSVGMVYRAFHTTKESRLESQPYTTGRGHVMPWDGRLDNRDELIERLGDDLNSGYSDLAIVASAFDRWDKNCLHWLIGDWAVTIWKPDQRELIFAVDYMAIRHIFYYLKKDHILWSTDLAPLVLLSGDKFHVDDDYIAGYFANAPDADLTPYCEIHEVPPGHFTRVRNGNATVERYWQFSPKSRIRYKTDAEYEDHFRRVFRQSVRRRLRSDSPILGELSGGLDSSSIVCMADDILAKEGAWTPRLDTLSFYDKTEPNGDDWVFFQKVEEKRRRVGAHIDASTLGRSPASLEYPDFTPLPGYFGSWRKLEAERAEVVRSGGYRAVLSGIGGDEFMGGIPNPTAHLADLIVQFKLLSLAEQLMTWSLVKRRPWIQLLWQALVDLLPSSIGQHFVKQAEVEPWIDKDLARNTRLAIRQIDVDNHFGLWLPTRRSYIGGLLMMANKMAKSTLPELALEETRYPYLDQNLIEFILSIPADQLLRPGERRSLMRRSLVGVVPQEILSRRTKQLGARTPVLVVDKKWEELRTVFGSPFISRFGYVNRRRFLEKLQAARNGEEVHIVRMLRAISLEFWLRDLTARGVLDSKSVSPPLGMAESLVADP
jgi:asparagine synthase (glutamine-hydrolysing)